MRYTWGEIAFLPIQSMLKGKKDSAAVQVEQLLYAYFHVCLAMCPIHVGASREIRLNIPLSSYFLVCLKALTPSSRVLLNSTTSLIVSIRLSFNDLN